MWAGVQKVSRPTVLSQEMSQISPTAMLVVASASKNPGQASGELATRSAGNAEGTACADAETPSITGAFMSPAASRVQLKKDEAGPRTGLHQALHPLPARNEWGEDRGEGKPIKTHLLSPALSSIRWRRGRNRGA